MLDAFYSVSDSGPEARLARSILAHLGPLAHSILARAVAAEDEGKETAPLAPSADDDSNSDSDVGTPLALTRGRERSAVSHRLVSKQDGSAKKRWQDTPPTSTRASSKRACPATPPGRERRPCPAQTKFFEAGAAPPPHLLAAAERAKSPTN